MSPLFIGLKYVGLKDVSLKDVVVPVLPTTKLAAPSLLSPENFVQIGPSIQKLFMIFPNTDTQAQKRITPVPSMGTGEKFLCPVSSTSLTLCRSG